MQTVLYMQDHFHCFGFDKKSSDCSDCNITSTNTDFTVYYTIVTYIHIYI